MSFSEAPYLELLEKILYRSEIRQDRTGVGTLSIFGSHMSFSMQNILPVITTKKMWIRAIIEELLFFVSGKTDTKILENKSIMIWQKNTSRSFLDEKGLNWREGDMGPGYGFQWRHWGAEYTGCEQDYTGQGIDQLQNLIDGIKADPFGRRHILSTWNVDDISQMALPPCHCFVQFYVSTCGKYLDCMLFQRSGDMFLGVPFNITSYCLLCYIIAHLTGKQPRTFHHTLGDAHIYTKHIEQVREQLLRKPYDFPELKILGDPKSLSDFTYESFEIGLYYFNPAINAEMFA